MSLYKTFKTDPSLETSGVDLNYGANESGEQIIIRIARAGGANKAYEKALANKIRPIKRQIQTGTVAEATLKEIMREVYAETVILGWEGVEDENGDPLPFTSENAKKLFVDLPDLFSDIQGQAQEIAIFRTDVMDETVKN